VQPEDRHQTTNESRHYENSDGMACDTIATGPAKSASESPDKGSKGRKRKYPTKAGPSKSKRRVRKELGYFFVWKLQVLQ
jgi:hypothetical protein